MKAENLLDNRKPVLIFVRLAVFISAVVFCFLNASCRHEQRGDSDQVRLSIWDRGIKIEAGNDPAIFAYFWFYEWHLFDAVKKGEHTPGKYDWQWKTDFSGQSALMDEGWLKLKIDAGASGADMLFEITNTSGHDWPDIAAIIPCFNPGSERGRTDAQENTHFFDDSYINTWFLGAQGLELIKGEEFAREIHFNSDILPAVLAWEKESDTGEYVFSDKWPPSERPARAGLIIRESLDHQWVMGIAWADYVSVQGHNPWRCMHLSIRVGPLRQGEKKSIHGKIYLFRGSKEDCLNLYQQDFAEK